MGFVQTGNAVLTLLCTRCESATSAKYSAVIATGRVMLCEQHAAEARAAKEVISIKTYTPVRFEMTMDVRLSD